MTQMLLNCKLLRKDEHEVESKSVIEENKVIGLFFGAQWCSPCDIFIKQLKDFYEELKKEKAPFEVIYVSSDKSSRQFLEFFKEAHGDWYAFHYKSQVAMALFKQFGVTAVPVLIVISENGTLITREGKSDIQEKGIKAFDHWLQTREKGSKTA